MKTDGTVVRTLTGGNVATIKMEPYDIKIAGVYSIKTSNDNITAKIYSSKAEVIARLKDIASSDSLPDKAEVEHLKAAYYKLSVDENEAQQKEYLAAGGDPAKYQIVPNEDDDIYKAELGLIKEKRAKFMEQMENKRRENLQKKLEIIEKIKQMATSPDEANKSYKAFKELQEQWKNIGSVPVENSTELWQNYHHYVEQFYDLLKLNSEARNYDFKKNLEAKTRLCEAAEALTDATDVVKAFHQLQELHQEYRELGPVEKDLREQIWNRFKAASTTINRRHQEYFEGLRSKEKDNLDKKTALCEKIEAVVKEENKTAADWDKHTQAILDLQEEWKKIGFAPQKMNVKIFERFRAACDEFFSAKAEYFKAFKDQLEANAAKKRELIEKAKSMMDSTDWKSTSNKFIALQKEWKNIGSVPRKVSDEMWNEFLTACNHFFDARNAAKDSTHNVERENLKAKREILAELKKLAEEGVSDVREKVVDLVEKYNKTGHVPFREKDKLYKEFHDTLDKIYGDLHISIAKNQMDKFRNNINNMAKRGETALDNERARLMRSYEQLRQEINTYENNLGFLNASSKKGSSLLDEMNRKVKKLKDDMELTKQKIKAIDAKFKENAKED
jgi:chromosome segregation ATPase